MDKLHLEFRSLLPEGNKGQIGDGFFYQNTQYLTSFLRRVLALWGVEHPKYIKEKTLEDLLQIKINGEWVQCEFKN